ncbi:hypothetical protein [Kitasatospora terrestris]
MRSESSDTVAQPDGKLVTTTYVQPKRVRKGGAWVDIDPALHTLPNGAVAPKAATADVEFSGGGSAQPLVRIANAGKELKLSWPKPLPKPVVDGSTAEYGELLNRELAAPGMHGQCRGPVLRDAGIGGASVRPVLVREDQQRLMDQAAETHRPTGGHHRRRLLRPVHRRRRGPRM